MAWRVVDTNVISFQLKEDTRARAYRRHLVGHVGVVSFMSVAELEEWAELHRWGQARRQRLQHHLDAFVVQFPDRALCRLWGDVRVYARREGRRIRCGGRLGRRHRPCSWCSSGHSQPVRLRRRCRIDDYLRGVKLRAHLALRPTLSLVCADSSGRCSVYCPPREELELPEQICSWQGIAGPPRDRTCPLHAAPRKVP